MSARSIAPLQRAYTVLDIKAVDSEQRVITGVATSVAPDRVGDIVEPDGAEFKLPLPLLWQHDKEQPIGEVFATKVGPQGIEIQARIAKTDVPGLLKDRLDLAWQSIGLRLVRGLSIGFKPIGAPEIIKETGGYRFVKWLWLELSAVTIPANSDASIQTIRSLDIGAGASATAPGVRHPSGVSDKARVVSMRTDRPMKKSFSDQIASWEATRQAKTARMDEILAGSAETGVTLDEAQQEEHDRLEGEVKGIDAQLVRLRNAEMREKSAAVPVVTGTGYTPSIRVNSPALPKGIRFARYVACKATAAIDAKAGDFTNAYDVARKRYPDDDHLHAMFTKGAVVAGTTIGSNAYDDLAPYQVVASDFIDYLRPNTIIDRIEGMDRVPFNARIGGLSAGTTGYWVGEALPIPLSRATSTNKTLTHKKVGGLTVLSQEIVRLSTPSAEAKIRQDLASAVTAAMDLAFIDPSNTGTTNVKPAAITSGIVATAPTGTTAAKFRADLATMQGLFAANNLNGRGLLIMSRSMATQLALMINTVGNPDFGTMSADGGTIAGIPVLVSEHLTSVGSPSTQMIVLCQPSEIAIADDGQVGVEASTEASVEMLDSALQQSGQTGNGASMVSLWQSGLVGIKAERMVDWVLKRSTAVRYISPAAYVVQ